MICTWLSCGSFPSQAGFAGERGFWVTGAVRGSQDPLWDTLAAGRAPAAGPLCPVVPTLDPELRTDRLFSGLERCDVGTVLLRRQNSGWVFENPCKATASAVSLGVPGSVGMGSLAWPALREGEGIGHPQTPSVVCRGVALCPRGDRTGGV